MNSYFVWPSDRARAENPELNRVCEYLEEVLDEQETARAQGGQGAEVDTVYVDCRECDVCGHAGINDSHESYAACHKCDWSGPEPEQDRCPGCDEENCMAAACPKCSGCYVLIAEKTLTTQPQPAVPEETVNAVISLVKDAAAAHLNSEFSLCLSKIRKLLSAAPQPAQQGSVPEGLTYRWVLNNTKLHNNCWTPHGMQRYVDGWNDCRHAMLCRTTPQTAQQGSVPEETEAMVDAACKVFEDAGARVDLGWLGEACRAYVAAAFTPTAPEGEGQNVPDMFWLADNNEEMRGFNEWEFADSVGQDMDEGETKEVRVQLAKSLPDRWMRISVDSEGEAHWGWVKRPQPPVEQEGKGDD